MEKNKVVLCILDGWGIAPLTADNGLIVAKNWQNILTQWSNCVLQASESWVGLPTGQMGNSEVGHTAIGLGRVIMQDLPLINQLIASGDLWQQLNIKNFIQKTKQQCHVMGLFSKGGVHSHAEHIKAVINYLLQQNIMICLHTFLDGRDTPPHSALNEIKNLEQEFANHPLFKIASVSGRFFSMDRDQRWDRTAQAYAAIIDGKASNSFTLPSDYIAQCYKQGIGDEFIPPAINKEYFGAKSNDSLWIMNFRADRVRQILKSFLHPDFQQFKRERIVKFSSVLGMGNYADYLEPYLLPAFSKTPLDQGLGEIIAENGLKQLRIAETEKYAHVTFFFNGGTEKLFAGEERILIPSPAVTTYDQAPAMSAEILTDKTIEILKSQKFSLIVMNYANADMVGHTGVSSAILQAIKVVDQCLQRLVEAAIVENYTLIITADHGNAEQMTEGENQPHTAHTCNPVPFVLVNPPQKFTLVDGSLADIAPTILKIMSLPQPESMTGKSLI